MSLVPSRHSGGQQLTKAIENSSTLNLVTVLSIPKERPFYIALTGFSYGGGCILGPLVGGALADSPATWRWVSCHLATTSSGDDSGHLTEVD